MRAGWVCGGTCHEILAPLRVCAWRRGAGVGSWVVVALATESFTFPTVPPRPLPLPGAHPPRGVWKVWAWWVSLFALDHSHFALRPDTRDGHGLHFTAHLRELEKRLALTLRKGTGTLTSVRSQPCTRTHCLVDRECAPLTTSAWPLEQRTTCTAIHDSPACFVLFHSLRFSVPSQEQ